MGLTRLLSLATTVAVALTALAAGLAPAPASAAQKYTTVSYARSAEVKTEYGCFSVSISGKAKAERYSYNSLPSQDPHFDMVGHRNPSIIKPVVRASRMARCRKSGESGPIGIGGRSKKLELTQSFYGSNCSTNLSYSVSFPWGVSVSAAPGCSEASIASRSVLYGAGNTWAQHNSGSPVSWKQKGTAYNVMHHKATLCARAAGRITVWKSRTKSDTVDVGFTSICWYSDGKS